MSEYSVLVLTEGSGAARACGVGGTSTKLSDLVLGFPQPFSPSPERSPERSPAENSDYVTDISI